MLFAVPLSLHTLSYHKGIVSVLIMLVCTACQHPPVAFVEKDQVLIRASDAVDPALVDIVKTDTIPEIIVPALGGFAPPDGFTIPEDRPDVVEKPALYSIAVQQVPVAQVLQALASDSKLKLDIVGDVKGDISLTMLDSPLELILDRITTLLPVRYEVQQDGLLVLQDTPVVRNYEVDYLNMQRLSESRVDLATQVGSISTSVEGDTSGQTGNNGSRLFVENKTQHNFWSSVVASINGLLGGSTEKDAKTNGNIFVNRESGIISVRALHSQHQSIEQLLSEVLDSAQRQVLIEATVVEVALNDRFESGVDWKLLAGSSDSSIDYSQIFSGTVEASDAVTPVNALLTFNNNSSLGNLSATLKLLQQFGEVQVLSSPRIIAMNNQPAVLKVVDNRVYFTFEVDRMQRENGDESTVVDSTVHSVPIGLVMNVTPFINSHDEVILNVRPTISRILNFAEDPSPALAGQNEIRNLIPEIQVREIESLLRVSSGEVAVIGGLMQNKTDHRNNGVPGLQRIPWFGKLFSHDTRTVEKTELLIFLKPTVVKTTARGQ